MTVEPYLAVMNSEVRTEMASRERVMALGELNQPMTPDCPLRYQKRQRYIHFFLESIALRVVKA